MLRFKAGWSCSSERRVVRIVSLGLGKVNRNRKSPELRLGAFGSFLSMLLGYARLLPLSALPPRIWLMASYLDAGMNFLCPAMAGSVAPRAKREFLTKRHDPSTTGKGNPMRTPMEHKSRPRLTSQKPTSGSRR